MRLIIALVTGVTALTLGYTRDEGHAHEHHAVGTSSSSEAPIMITINPEARVSVVRGGELPPDTTCGRTTELPVKIVNQGFVTAPLEARLVDSVPEGVGLEFSAEPLKGSREEHRVLRVTLTKPGPVDITIAFRAKNDIPDLGGRDRIHLLVNCKWGPLAREQVGRR